MTKPVLEREIARLHKENFDLKDERNRLKNHSQNQSIFIRNVNALIIRSTCIGSLKTHFFHLLQQFKLNP